MAEMSPLRRRMLEDIVRTHQKLRNRLVEFQGATKRC